MFINYSKLGVTINEFNNAGSTLDIEDIVFAVHHAENITINCDIELQSALDFLCDGEALAVMKITDEMQDAVEYVYDKIKSHLNQKSFKSKVI